MFGIGKSVIVLKIFFQKITNCKIILNLFEGYYFIVNRQNCKITWFKDLILLILIDNWGKSGRKVKKKVIFHDFGLNYLLDFI